MPSPVPTTHSFRTRVWLWPGPAAWHFVSLPKKLSGELRRVFRGYGRGFGSLPVRVTIGSTTWTTSIFPDHKRGSYLLPLKASVRKVEGLRAGRTAHVTFIVQP
ncbi:MAG: DUF1905 domain-containing protein [Candidatus Kerfeldbacteria bacterium]|nr:DUF1905 domain-containing protein [Candidatus Kerfeldbacteria bacterium]